ncbi:PHD finger ALFIN-LIKE 4, partial [Olea europaea subsp. europaea]
SFSSFLDTILSSRDTLTIEEVYEALFSKEMMELLVGDPTSSDVEEFYQRCDPEKENLCLYGFPSEQWDVSLPAEVVPPEIPEPALGINFARDGMQEKDWLALVAVNDLVLTRLTGAAKKKVTEKSSVSNHGSTKSKSNLKRGKPSKFEENDENEELDEEEEHGETLCGACGENYSSDEFWICCDMCERWFHGNCVKITPARAEHIKQYKCPLCSSKRAPRP